MQVLQGLKIAFIFTSAVILNIKGYAETHWADTEHDPDDQSNGESFNGHVDYLATRAYLHGSSSSIGMFEDDKSP